MEFITDNRRLTKAFGDLAEGFREFYWAVAWASPDDQMLKILANSSKSSRVVVGLDGLATHPHFLEKFSESDVVRFVRGDTGLFHPKVYLFWNSRSDWRCIIGSPNFTGSAFEKNHEASLQIGPKDGRDLGNTIRNYVLENWRKGFAPSLEQISDYRARWGRRVREEGALKRSQKMENIGQRDLLSKTWAEYLKLVSNEGARRFGNDATAERTAILDRARELFRTQGRMDQMELEARRCIFGLINYSENNGSGWWAFGSTRNTFGSSIENDMDLVADALALIPPVGSITESDYVRFVEEMIHNNDKIKLRRYRRGDGAWSVGFRTSTRLLVMKRPDYFVSINRKIEPVKFQAEFGFGPLELTFENYWTHLLAQIQASSWWNSPRPTQNAADISVWDARSAFLDSIFYEEYQ